MYNNSMFKYLQVCNSLWTQMPRIAHFYSKIVKLIINRQIGIIFGKINYIEMEIINFALKEHFNRIIAKLIMYRRIRPIFKKLSFKNRTCLFSVLILHQKTCLSKANLFGILHSSSIFIIILFSGIFTRVLMQRKVPVSQISFALLIHMSYL